MNDQDVLSWLNRGYKTDTEIDALLQARETAYERATTITAQLSGAGGGSPDPHRFESFTMYESEIITALDKLFSIKSETAEIISRLPDSRQRAVLYERYVNFSTREQTAARMHYSVKQIGRITAEALKALKPLLESVLECP